MTGFTVMLIVSFLIPTGACSEETGETPLHEDLEIPRAEVSYF